MSCSSCESFSEDGEFVVFFSLGGLVVRLLFEKVALFFAVLAPSDSVGFSCEGCHVGMEYSPVEPVRSTNSQSSVELELDVEMLPAIFVCLLSDDVRSDFMSCAGNDAGEVFKKFFLCCPVSIALREGEGNVFSIEVEDTWFVHFSSVEVLSPRAHMTSKEFLRVTKNPLASFRW